jgi:hypothetical protein
LLHIAVENCYFKYAEKGVLAYGKKPIPRSKPNNRFLQNTLKSVDFGELRRQSSSTHPLSHKLCDISTRISAHTPLVNKQDGENDTVHISMPEKFKQERSANE